MVDVTGVQPPVGVPVVGVGVRVFVIADVSVRVGVRVGVSEIAGVNVRVGVRVGVSEIAGVNVRVGVRVGVLVAPPPLGRLSFW